MSHDAFLDAVKSFGNQNNSKLFCNQKWTMHQNIIAFGKIKHESSEDMSSESC